MFCKHVVQVLISFISVFPVTSFRPVRFKNCQECQIEAVKLVAMAAD